MEKPTAFAAYTALTTSALVWGGSIVGQKVALGAFSAVETSILRGVGALAILIPLWWWTESARTALTMRDLKFLSLLGLGVLGNHLLTLFGLRYIGASTAGVIIGASPAITALLSSLLVRDIPFKTVAGGCALSFAGVALVSGLGGDASSGESPWLGGLLVLLGLISWALYSIGGREVMERLSPLTVNWTTLLISLLLQIPLLWTDRKLLVTGIDVVPVSGWLALLYLIVFATALGQQAWLYGVKGVGPSRAGVFVNLIPVSALLLSAVILGETIGMREIVGIILILVGVWLVGWQSARLKQTE
ncbi:MAG: Permease of the drug/metabolite transporter (DMT) superfamily [Nitrospira sp.]|jgi:drug/metabolite transporter (DMT)-like permease|nr:MAG: Permease of the drug/metabolite transporter (DMT) superfamily [Nitrospira sp.]